MANPDRTSAAAPATPRPGGKHQRRIANYLIDKRLQLRYVLIVLGVSLAIAGTLGYLIYQQEHRATADLVAGLADLTDGDASLADYQRETAADIAHRDRALVLQMVAIGFGFVVILGGYLVLMTHKVAGPLHKIGLYMHDMAAGKMGAIMPLRKGDMLQDFYGQFRDMHSAVRERLQGDAVVMARFHEVCTAGQVGAEAKDELDELGRHAAQRQASLT